MKKILVLLPMMLALTIVAFAGNDDEARAKANFNRQFAGAENVSWSTVNSDYHKVSFVWAGHRTEAYFGQDGKFVGAIRGLFYQQLPLAVVRTVDEKYEDRVILEAREITNESGTTYSVLMNWKNKRYRVRLQADGTVVETESYRK